MSFKILAVEVLQNCSSKHYKNLEKNIPYKLFSNYQISKEKIVKPCNEFNLYSNNRKDLYINISAIVGKNGSGKSTLVELIIKAINNFFYRYREQHTKKKFHTIYFVKGLELNLYYEYQQKIFRLHVFDGDYKVYEYKGKEGSFVEPTQVQRFKLDDIFYTEVINYSLYAYNSSDEEEGWITKVFHKNDGYQTPIVLNPFRKNGNIDINTENDLVFQRLLSNLLKFHDNKLNLEVGDNLIAASLIFSLKEEKRKVFYEDENGKWQSFGLSGFKKIEREQIIQKVALELCKQIIDLEKIPKKVLIKVRAYILYKLISICTKYEEYKNDYFDIEDKSFINLDGLIDLLKDDYSHITFKLRQVINFLIHQHITFDENLDENVVSIEVVAKSIKRLCKNDIITFLPPSIFKIDIELKSLNLIKSDSIRFNTLSSGEKQFIYLINSIYYHLINIDSVSKSNKIDKTSYKYVSIILEEIELYFHPDYQRNLISRLLNGLKKIKFSKIRGLHFIFVTHSPFILSDIPSSNVLRMSNGIFLEDCQLTFGANIYDILKDSFFLENGVMGKFAEESINTVINFIETCKDTMYSKGSILDLILLIDEPIIKDKLYEMYMAKFPDMKNRDLEEEIIRSYANKYGRQISFE